MKLSTVIDVMRAMDVTPKPRLVVRVGNVARHAYKKKHGVLPEKALRPKTRGSGTHFIAVYPTTFRRTIRGIISRAI